VKKNYGNCLLLLLKFSSFKDTQSTSIIIVVHMNYVVYSKFYKAKFRQKFTPVTGNLGICPIVSPWQAHCVAMS